MKSIKLTFIIFALSMYSCDNAKIEKEVSSEAFQNMAIKVSSDENRPISFANKKSAYYYTQSHLNNHPEHSYFEGLTVAQEKAFSGYELYSAKELNNMEDSKVVVYPHKFTRTFDNSNKEELILFDYINLLEVSVWGSIDGIKLKEVEFIEFSIDKTIAYYKSSRSSYIIGVSTIQGLPLKIDSNIIEAEGVKRFVLVSDKDKSELPALINNYKLNRDSLLKSKVERFEDLINNRTFISSNVDSLDLGMNWMWATMDQLVSEQTGNGIYAGLPWFAEYWGRDEFISMPGATLVNGDFEVARKILESFAKYQDTNPESKYFGRVPNIVKTSGVNYNTTDGTPRFVIQLEEYVKYTGDTDIINKLYENVKYSIDGSLKNWTDNKGYLLHEDNETWMDARRQGDLAAYSPRDTRANDIQALWYNQLKAGVYFATYMDDRESAKKWLEISEKLKHNFEKDFTSPDKDFIADRLDENDVAEYFIRPNQLFAFEMVENKHTKAKALKTSWEELVYPWGTASLDRNHEFFHPFHLSWDNYHKDQAYHNGTVWLWLNGIAMQRMIEFDQTEIAYKLFWNMNQQALNNGVVGGLAENSDAYPHEGKSWPKLTGTYLQAWSNAEQLRVWYQYFLGVKPDLVNNKVYLRPRIPNDINNLKTNVFIGKGKIDFTFAREDNVYEYAFNDLKVDVELDFIGFEPILISVNNQKLIIEMKQNKLHIKTISKDRVLVEEKVLDLSKLLSDENMEINNFFKNTDFCSPIDISNHKVMEQVYDRN